MATIKGVERNRLLLGVSLPWSIYITLVTQDSPIRYEMAHNMSSTNPLYGRSLLKLSIKAAMIVSVKTN